MGKDRKSYGKPTEAFSRNLAERTASGLRLDNMMKVRIAVLLFGLGINREMQDPVTRTKAPAIDIRGAMTRVVSTIRIRRDIADVFDFVTTPKNWPEWHPASISVAGSMDHSLMIGEEVTEEFIAAGRRGRTVWRVTAREAPYLWRIESSESEALATITYRLHTEAGMTVFERDMQYHFGPPMISPKAMFLRRRMERESREALFRAKQILEKS